MKTYNGFRSWNAYNVSLWILNDENMYHWCRELTREMGRKKAAAYLAETLANERTPDGARYSKTSVYEALKGIL